MDKKITKKLLVIIIINVFIITLLGLIVFANGKDVIKITSEKDTVEEKKVENTTYIKYKNINEDYICQLTFDSGLLDVPVVQATSTTKSNGTPYRFFNQNGSIVQNPDNYTGNDVYIWMDFVTMEYDYDKKGGSIFMDYRNTLDDQNIIIYGHYFSKKYNKDPERKKAFTPLEKLLEEGEYEKNRIVRMQLENEVRVYELFAVYEFDSSNDEFFEKGQYYRTDYSVDEYTGEVDNNYMDEYIKFVNQNKLYDTGVNLTNKDKTLTLQTCMTPYENLYEICVFKLITTYDYE